MKKLVKLFIAVIVGIPAIVSGIHQKNSQSVKELSDKPNIVATREGSGGSCAG